VLAMLSALGLSILLAFLTSIILGSLNRSRPAIARQFSERIGTQF
jgi:hypothetical protein